MLKPTIATSRKPTLDKRVLSLQALAIAAMLLVTWLVWKRGQPERLLDLGTTVHYDILAGGTLYRTAYRDTENRLGLSILSHPVQGGAERTIVEEDARYDLYSHSVFAVSDGSLFYGLCPHRKPVMGGGVSVGGASITQFLGVFALSAGRVPERGHAPEKRVRRSQYFSSPIAVHFRSAPIQGGTARDLATIHCSTAPMLIGSHAFWIRQAQLDPLVYVTRGNETWTEVSAADSLVLTDLVNGSEKAIDKVFGEYGGLTRGESGVFWTKLHPFPNKTRDLYYARAADGVVLHLGEVPENQTVGWSVEYRGSLYWFYVRNGFDRNGSVPGTLMAGHLNGANIGPVVSLTDLQVHDVPGENLFAYHGALYCLVGQADQSIPAQSRQILLEQIYADRKHPLELVCKLPVQADDFHFDQGYLYFNVIETERGLMATLADDNAGDRLRATLCRVPLPR